MNHIVAPATNPLHAQPYFPMDTLLKWLSVTHRMGKIYLDRHLEPWGINSTQHFFVLRICENEGITQDKLPALIHLNKSNIARALNHLEKAGLVRKDAYKKDKRTARLYPTEKAKILYTEIQAIEESWRQIILHDLTGQDRQKLLLLLQKTGTAALNHIIQSREELSSPPQPEFSPPL